jgi:hypothetical protein
MPQVGYASVQRGGYGHNPQIAILQHHKRRMTADHPEKSMLLGCHLAGHS